jgi:hypothetical protein
MTDDDRPARNWGTYVFFALMALFIGALMLVRATAEPVQNLSSDVRNYTPVPTHTPQNTIAIQLDVKTEEKVTTTPVPDFAAIQRALDDAVSEHKASVATQVAQAANVATATELAHVSRMNDTEYDGAVSVLSSKIQALNYEEELHRQTISHTVELQAVELREMERYISMDYTIRLIGSAAWRGFALLVVVALTMWFFWFLYLRTAEPDEYVEERVILEVITDKTKKRFDDLPVDKDKFKVWAEYALAGRSLSYPEWAGKNMMFTRPEYDKLTTLMRNSGIIEFVGGEPSQGQQVTKAGVGSLSTWVLRGE